MSHDPTSNDSRDNHDVGDRNVERLLAGAYEPETPEPAFVGKATAAMHATAAERRASRRASPGRPRRLTRSPVTWVVAASMLVAVGALVGPAVFRASRPQPYHVVAPRVPADEQLDGNQPNGARVPTMMRAVAEDGAVSSGPLAGSPMIARPRPLVLPAEKLALGGSLETGAERRRLALPDGSILYLNRHTAVRLDGPRQLTLERGEVYVEVAPKAGPGRSGADSPASPGTRFTVITPDRRVTALATKFDVRLTGAGTAVVVAQGKVDVSGVEEPVRAGQQVIAEPGRASPSRGSPAPRMSHVIDWTRDLMAAAHSPLVPGSKYSGGALTVTDRAGQESKLSLRKYHVDVHVEDGFARTTIDQTYFNHRTERLEGTFHFPLPPDASLSRLAMYVSGKLMEGGMAERGHARRVFETIQRRMKDPALLEWVDGSTFKMRVFPLEGRQEKRIVLSYTQRLASLYDRTAYRFPGGHSIERVGKWSCRIRASGGAKTRWTSHSHPFKATRDHGDLVLEAAAENVAPDQDVVLSLFAARSAETPRARFASAEHEGSKYLMLRLRLDLPELRTYERRDWVFLFESSADRDPLLARVQVDVVKTLLENANRDDTFSILTAGTRVHAMADKPRRATAKNVQRAVKFLEETHLIGALDLDRALSAARPLWESAENPCLVHVGSGLPVLGERRVDVLAKRIPKDVPYVGVGVGKRWSRALMKTAAGRTGGYFTQINPDEQVAWRAFELLATLNTPRLFNVRVVDEAERHTFLCHSDYLADGEELSAIARMDKDDELPKSLEVTGTLDGAPFSEKIPVRDVAPRADYLPRTWAKLEIDRLVADGAEKNRSEIIRLSKAMYVMSPFTSLLVLENDRMYEEYHVDRGRKDHWALYPCPEEIPVVHEPLPSPPVARVPADRDRGKPTPEEVLNTVLLRVPPRSIGSPMRTITARELESVRRAAELDPENPLTAQLLTTSRVIRHHFGDLGLSRARKEGFWEQMDGVELGAIPFNDMEPYVFADVREWEALSMRRRAWRSEHGEPRTDRALETEKRLDTPVLLQYENDPLSRVADDLARLAAVKLHLDPQGLADEGVRTNDPVTINLSREISLKSALNLILEPLRLNYTVEDDGTLRITSEQRRDDRDAKALRAARQRAVVDTLYEIERAYVPFPDEPPMVYPSPEVWQRLTARRRARYAAMDLAGIGSAEERIAEELRSPTRLEFVETPLGEVIDTLGEFHEIRIEIDERALEDVGIPVDLPMTKHIKGISLRSALRLLLGELDLTYVIEDDALKITTPEEAEVVLGGTRVYSVADLVVPLGPETLRGGMGRMGGGWMPSSTRYDLDFDGDRSVTIGLSAPGVFSADLYVPFDSELRTEIEQLQDRIHRLEQSKAPLVVQQKQRRDNAESELARALKEYNDARRALSDQAQKQLQAFQQRQQKADGEIRWVNERNRTAWIDLGADDALQPLTSFSVYPADTNDVTRVGKKGSIEVTLILDEHLAEARIVEDAPGDPIVPGDLIDLQPEPSRYNGVPPVIDGVVLSVGANGLIEISIGSDDGLRKGHKLEVVRPAGGASKRLGRVEVTEASPDTAVCRVLPEHRHGPILRNDRVTTKLDGASEPRPADRRPVRHDLLSYAPGLNTTPADLVAVLEAETPAPDESPQGEIDKRARRLIQKVRSAGWRRATPEDGVPGPSIEFDGKGRLRYERVTGSGLREQVLADGTHLWHLYGELGLGARRELSRFHRARLLRRIPWALPPVDELARGADLRLVDERTVAIVPRGAEEAKGEDGKPAAYRAVRLVFDADGRLAERRLVRMPLGEPLLSQVLDAGGAVRWLDGDGELLVERKYRLEPCEAPRLEPDAERLVVLPMPLRSRKYLDEAAGPGGGADYEKTSEDVALVMIASELGKPRATEIIRRRFLEQGDSRLGFYVLWLAGGVEPESPKDDGPAEDEPTPARFEPRADHPDEPLAKYLAAYVKARQGDPRREIGPIGGPADGFLQQLAAFHDLWLRWESAGEFAHTPEAEREHEQRVGETIDFIRASTSRRRAWAMLAVLLDEVDALETGGTGARAKVAEHRRELARKVAGAAEPFTDVPGVRCTARYEHARLLALAGQRAQARELIAKLYDDAIRSGFMPPVDGDFRATFFGERQDAGATEAWAEFVRPRSAELARRGTRPEAIRLARSLHRMDDAALAEEVFSEAMAGVTDGERWATTLQAVEYLWQSGQRARADAALEQLLRREEYARVAALWRLAAVVAEKQGMTARRLACLERAMELEYDGLPEVVELAPIRAEYGGLLGGYQELATAAGALGADASVELIGQIVRTADRWRSLDTDPEGACRRASRILADLGAADLAWDYFTTAVGADPQKPIPWNDLAETLHGEGRYGLADRAYAWASTADPANAEIVWNRAQALREAGRTDDARPLLRKLAEGEWDGQYEAVQSRAKRYLEKHQ